MLDNHIVLLPLPSKKISLVLYFKLLTSSSVGGVNNLPNSLLNKFSLFLQLLLPLL